MSAASCLRSEDQFLCSVCLDVFTDPVTIPCGHNFCKNCINKHWNRNNQYRCPMCKKGFRRRPELHINTLLSEMVSQFRQEAQQKASSSKQQAAKLMSCLVLLVFLVIPVCLAFIHFRTQLMDPVENLEDRMCMKHNKPLELFCKTDLTFVCVFCSVLDHKTHDVVPLKEEYEGKKNTGPEVLSRVSGVSGLPLAFHFLINRVENLEERMCMKHNKPLELFCKTDQTCVSTLCTSSDHKTHDVVPLKEAYEGKNAELGKTEAEIQEMIQKRRLKIQEIKHSVDLSEQAADREKAEGVQVFTALMESFERTLNELIETIEEKQRTTEKQAEDFIKELEQEISELKKRSSEVEKLSHSADPLYYLLIFQSLKAALPTKDWTEVSVRPSSYEGTVVRAVAQLEETLSKQMKKLFEAELKRVQQYAVDVTLDPDTAHPNLILSGNGKQVYDSDEWQNLPDNPERFSHYIFVLGKQSLSSGRFYFEVQVKDKTYWSLGLARESIKRKGDITMSPKNGYWTICWTGNYYLVLGDPPVYLSLKSRLQKVGVFVDYEEGLVSFYDVDAAALICSFTGCSFTEKLYPFFSPGPNYGGKNSAPLIVSPVNQSA